ncbi:MAG: pantetheine-phosphate adenylyltransferase [Candidatus Cloacimonetes bacterium]|nr:pantetheine-phosphate adenylyltransferase [Candidatus Cloacimonadota bacterium]
MNNIAIYPGTFDPITNGHIDILVKATKLFDKVILAVAEDSGKDNLFSASERVKLCKNAVKNIDRVEVAKFSGLVVDYARSIKAIAMIRGLRAVSDFEYELQLALMNRQLNPKIDTIFLIPNYKYFYLSSSLIKQIIKLGGELKDFVPENVKQAVKKKYKLK